MEEGDGFILDVNFSYWGKEAIRKLPSVWRGDVVITVGQLYVRLATQSILQKRFSDLVSGMGTYNRSLLPSASIDSQISRRVLGSQACGASACCPAVLILRPMVQSSSRPGEGRFQWTRGMKLLEMVLALPGQSLYMCRREGPLTSPHFNCEIRSL